MDRAAFCALCSLFILVADRPCVAQPPDIDPDRADPQELWSDNFGGPGMAATLEKLKKLGPWDEQAKWITSAQQAVFERNGWNSEADQYARRLASTIESLPPWRLDQRFDTFCKMTTQRYGLDEDQQQALRAQLIRESFRVATRYGPALFKNVDLFVNRRVNGQPLDADTVSQMVKNAGPLVDDLSAEAERFFDEFEAGLDDRQREIFRRDRESFQRRRDDVKAKMDRWANGDWSPEEWGMDKDPLYAASKQPDGAPGSTQVPAVAQPVAPAAPYETAWEMYVQQFIKKHDLDAAQQRAAWSVLHDVQRRAARVWSRVPDAPGADGMTNQRRREAAIRPLYDELLSRLDQILTPYQRRQTGTDRAGEER